MIKEAVSMPAIFTINSIFWVIFHSHFNATHSPSLFFKLSRAFSMVLFQTEKSLQITSEYLPHPKFTLT